MKALATIGYETATLPDVVQRLKAADVKVVIDVRAVASSRKAGFSKTLLSNTLKDEGIDYVHLQKLGTPKPGRDAARQGQIGKMHDIFNTHMEEPEPQMQLVEAIEIATARKAALLCYEDDHLGCHRSILADTMQERGGFEIENL
jgi:uncharacterized protein (DUF488 family)